MLLSATMISMSIMGMNSFGISSAFVKGGVVSHNRIAGSGSDAAIRIFGISNRVILNDYEGFSSSYGNLGILLQAPSSGNRVVISGDPDTEVLDQGTNNTVVNTGN